MIPQSQTFWWGLGSVFELPKLFIITLAGHDASLHQLARTMSMEAGPEIPPHILEKRKRKAEEAAAIVSSIYNKPDAPKALEKRPRIIGPALPPSPLDERPSHSPQEDDDSSDNEIGPSLPSGLGPEVKLSFSCS